MNAQVEYIELYDLPRPPCDVELIRRAYGTDAQFGDFWNDLGKVATVVATGGASLAVPQVNDQVGQWVSNGAAVAGKALSDVGKEVQKGITSIKDLCNQVPVLGPALSGLVDLSLPGVSLTAAILQGESIDKALLDDFNRAISAAKAVAPIAKMIVSFIPGIGTGVAAAIAAASALAEGQPIEKALLDAVMAAIPGGAIAQAVCTAAVAAAQGQNIAEAALGAVGEMVAGRAGRAVGEIAGSAITAAASGQDVGQALIQSGTRELGEFVGGKAGEAVGALAGSALSAAAGGKDVGQALLSSGATQAGKILGGQSGGAVGALAGSALAAASTGKDVGQALLAEGTSQAGKLVGNQYAKSAAALAGSAAKAATTGQDVGQAFLAQGLIEASQAAKSLKEIQSLPPEIRENLTIVNKAVRGEDVGADILAAATKALPKELADASTIGMAVGKAKQIQEGLISKLRTMTEGEFDKFRKMGDDLIAQVPEFVQAGRLLEGLQREGFRLGCGLMEASGVNEGSILALRDRLSEEARKGFDLAISARIGIVTKHFDNANVAFIQAKTRIDEFKRIAEERERMAREQAAVESRTVQLQNEYETAKAIQSRLTDTTTAYATAVAASSALSSLTDSYETAKRVAQDALIANQNALIAKNAVEAAKKIVEDSKTASSASAAAALAIAKLKKAPANTYGLTIEEWTRAQEAEKVAASGAGLPTDTFRQKMTKGRTDFDSLKTYYWALLPEKGKEVQLQNFAYMVTEGMKGAPVESKEAQMRIIAANPIARVGAVEAVKVIAERRKSLWLRLKEWFGFHGEGGCNKVIIGEFD